MLQITEVLNIITSYIKRYHKLHRCYNLRRYYPDCSYFMRYDNRTVSRNKTVQCHSVNFIHKQILLPNWYCFNGWLFFYYFIFFTNNYILLLDISLLFRNVFVCLCFCIFFSLFCLIYFRYSESAILKVRYEIYCTPLDQSDGRYFLVLAIADNIDHNNGIITYS